MTSKQLHRLYFEMRETVFKDPWMGLACNSQYLEAILKDKFGEEMTMSTIPKKPK